MIDERHERTLASRSRTAGDVRKDGMAFLQAVAATQGRRRVRHQNPFP